MLDLLVFLTNPWIMAVGFLMMTAMLWYVVVTVPHRDARRRSMTGDLEGDDRG